MVPMPPSIRDVKNGSRIFKVESLLKLNEQLRVSTASTTAK